jgi:hypothetical protein
VVLGAMVDVGSSGVVLGDWVASGKGTGVWVNAAAAEAVGAALATSTGVPAGAVPPPQPASTNAMSNRNTAFPLIVHLRRSS